jgi:hypothetical protein
VLEREKTVHALDLAATVIGFSTTKKSKKKGRIKRCGDSSADPVIHLFGDGGELIQPAYGKNKFGADYEAK